jgi:hypothetical protein
VNTVFEALEHAGKAYPALSDPVCQFVTELFKPMKAWQQGKASVAGNMPSKTLRPNQTVSSVFNKGRATSRVIPKPGQAGSRPFSSASFWLVVRLAFLMAGAVRGVLGYSLYRTGYTHGSTSRYSRIPTDVRGQRWKQKTRKALCCAGFWTKSDHLGLRCGARAGPVFMLYVL